MVLLTFRQLQRVSSVRRATFLNSSSMIALVRSGLKPPDCRTQPPGIRVSPGGRPPTRRGRPMVVARLRRGPNRPLARSRRPADRLTFPLPRGLDAGTGLLHRRQGVGSLCALGLRETASRDRVMRQSCSAAGTRCVCRMPFASAGQVDHPYSSVTLASSMITSYLYP
jgi:hypothetical protein